MEERERERAVERERASSGGDPVELCASDGVKDFSSLDARTSRWKRSFEVESKTFEIELERKKGKTQIFIEERKRGVSSWIKMGPESLGFVAEGLALCIETHGQVDGKGGKGGWSAMLEILQALVSTTKRKEYQKEEKVPVAPCEGSSYALDQCIVGVVGSEVGKGGGLEEMGKPNGSIVGAEGKFRFGQAGKGLRKVGEKCGGFLAIDSQTERLEELQWARILVKISGEELPSMLELGVEGMYYSLTLWWEVRPVMRTMPAERKGINRGDAVGEVEGDVATRAGKRVMEVVEGARLETHLQSADGMRGQMDGQGLVGPSPEVQMDWVWGTKKACMEALPCWALTWAFVSKGLWDFGAVKSGRLYGGDDCHDPSGVALPLVWAGQSQMKEADAEGVLFWIMMAGGDKLKWSPVSQRNQEPTAERNSSLYASPLGPSEEENECRLREGSSACKESSGKMLRLTQSMPHVGKGWEEESWEESELAKFINDSAKRKVIKAMIRSQRVDMFCLQETKIQSMTEGLVRSLGTGRFLNWGTVDAQGMRNVEDGIVWMFTGVYGPFSKEEREWMWEEIGAIRGIWEDPWCIGGDFNVTLSMRERSNQGRLTSAMRRFAQVVDELELIDLPLQGGMLTWSGGRNNQAQPRPTSDHFPIVLMGGGIRRGPSPFRFENMWLKADGFSDLLRGWWQEIEVRGRASVRLATKMKVLKHKIKVWNREVFGRLEVNKNSALQQVEFWDGVEREEACLKERLN
ncbi:hypothetical protein CK203_004986 [Vitis vinifera]|uniref:DUF4283 domain-containing protein n=1 Tax=Vitis vinifera TaxID=29760 RepID=A0A438KF35_VITVI|nr:hypothetical protein CK203_004986 [Vitis vinifera]